MTENVPQKTTVAQAWLELRPENIDQALAFCGHLSKSGVVPKQYQGRPEDIFGAILAGAEIGLKPMQALQGMASINGIFKAYGTTAAAVIQGHRDFIDQADHWDDSTKTATVTMTRRGREAVTCSFGYDDAENAGLFRRGAVWGSFPKEMAYWRAWHMCVKRLFSDVAHGLADMAPAEIEAEYTTSYETPDKTAIKRGASAADKLSARLGLPAAKTVDTEAEYQAEAPAAPEQPSYTLEQALADIEACETPECVKELKPQIDLLSDDDKAAARKAGTAKVRLLKKREKDAEKPQAESAAPELSAEEADAMRDLCEELDAGTELKEVVAMLQLLPFSDERRDVLAQLLKERQANAPS